MNQILMFLLALGLLVIFIQDLRERMIHLILPIWVFVVSGVLLNGTNRMDYISVFWNIGFLLLSLALLSGYMSLKNKAILNPFENYFGIGDLLFYIAISPLFLFRNYILFFISSMIFAIIMQLILKNKMSHQSVPLAGFAALLLLFFIAAEFFSTYHKITLL